MIDRIKGFDKRKIHLTVKINFFLTAGSVKYQQMHLKSDKSEIISDFRTNKIIEKCFDLFVQRDRVGLTLFRMGFFGAIHKWVVGKRSPSLKSITRILQ